MHVLRCWFIAGAIASSPAFSQSIQSLVSDDSVLTTADSLFIFDLIDSLLALDAATSSQLALRLGYNSNVLSAGRTLGIQNFGIAPGISYYHRSGFYADVSGFWSADFEPAYYLTIVSAGYTREFSDKFSFIAGIDRYFYTLADADAYIPYRHSAAITPILDIKRISFTANYSFYFGDQRAHRIMPGISYTLLRKKILKLDRISITPAFYTLFGNEQIITQEYLVRPKSLREAAANMRLYGTPYGVVQTVKNVFGAMNYAFTLPVSISKKNFSFSFNYTYNIPRALPGEVLTFSKSTYLSASLLYFVDLHSKKNALQN